MLGFKADMTKKIEAFRAKGIAPKIAVVRLGEEQPIPEIKVMSSFFHPFWAHTAAMAFWIPKSPQPGHQFGTIVFL